MTFKVETDDGQSVDFDDVKNARESRTFDNAFVEQREDAINSLREHIGTLNRRVQSLKDAPLANDNPDTVVCHICGDEIPVGRAHEPAQGEYAGKPLCKSDFGTLVMDSDSPVSRDTATTPTPDTDPDGPTCERCGASIQGDPFLWYSAELCRECYDDKPPSREAFEVWLNGDSTEAEA